MPTDDDNPLAASTIDTASALSRMFAELLLQLRKTDALSKPQVAEIFLANERFISSLHQTEAPTTVLMHQKIHDEVLSFVEDNLPVCSYIEKQRQLHRKLHSG